MKPLPPGHARVLTMLADAEDAAAHPSRAEMAASLGYVFASGVSKHIEALALRDLVEIPRGRKRVIRLTDAGWAALGRHPARRGMPVVDAAGSVVGHDPDLTVRPGHVAIRAAAPCQAAGVTTGDLVVIRMGGPIVDGRFVAASVDGATVVGVAWGTGIEGQADARVMGSVVAVRRVMRSLPFSWKSGDQSIRLCMQ